MPQINIPEYWSEGGNFLQKLPGLENASLLKVIQFELGNKRLAAIGNFWEKGESFFSLKIKDLQQGQYILRDPLSGRTCLKNKDEKYFSSTDLKNGITLHAGALRWVFFIIEPFDQNIKYNDMITQDDLYHAMKKDFQQ